MLYFAARVSALPATLKYSAKNTFFHIYVSKENQTRPNNRLKINTISRPVRFQSQAHLPSSQKQINREINLKEAS
jgi:hypothetical protein